jgi:rubrerythrin
MTSKAPETPVDLAQWALEREKAAVRKYTEFAEVATDPKIRDMFLLLAEEETRHVALIRDEIDKETQPEN